MDKQEWKEYVHKVEVGGPIPASMIDNYDDWRCRSIVGRVLYVLGDIEGAMTVLSTVVKIQPNEEDVPEVGLSEVEHKVLCLRDVAEIVWQLTHQDYAPLVYLGEAYHYCRSYKHPFRSADRGAIWSRRLEIMRDSGANDKAVAEAQAMLEQEAGSTGENPYIFHADKFLAEDAAASGDYDKAAQLLAEAYKYYPVTETAKKDLADAAAEANPKARYEKYHHCTTIQYRHFEDDGKEVVVDHTHKGGDKITL